MANKKDLSELKHKLVNTPLHFYSEVKEDGTEVLRHIRVQQQTFEVPADGVTIDTIPADSVGSKEIQNKSVQEEDLSDNVAAGLHELDNVSTIGVNAARKIVAEAIKE